MVSGRTTAVPAHLISRTADLIVDAKVVASTTGIVTTDVEWRAAMASAHMVGRLAAKVVDTRRVLRTAYAATNLELALRPTAEAIVETKRIVRAAGDST